MVKISSSNILVKYLSIFSILFVCYGLVSTAIYWPFRTNVFSMDDPGLILFLENPQLSVLDQIFSTGANRWRPVANIAYVIAFFLGGENYQIWFFVNIFLLALGATFLAGLILKISKSWAVAIIAPFLLVTSRFVTYQVITATGLMEGLVTLLFICYLYALYRVCINPKSSSFVILLVSSTLLILSHERFQLLCGISAIAVFIFAQTRKQRLIWSALMITPVFLLVVMKKFVLNIPLFVGTGSATSLGFSLESTIVHLTQAISNLGGLVTGPTYLVGISWLDMIPSLQLLSILTFTLSSFFLFFAIYKYSVSLVGKKYFWSYLIISFLLVLGTLIPVLVTIRLEQRWLTTPYIALIAIVSFAFRSKAAKDISANRVLTFTGLLILGFSIFVNSGVRNSSDGYFFMEHNAKAQQLLGVLHPMLVEAGETGCKLSILNTEEAPDLESYVIGIVQANTSANLENIAVVKSNSENLDSCKFGAVDYKASTGFTSVFFR